MSRKGGIITDQEKAKIVALLNEGIEPLFIANRFDITREAVYKTAKEAGIKRVYEFRRQVRLTKNMIPTIEDYSEIDECIG